MSPAKSKKQQMFMGAELARKRAGKKTKTQMSEKQLSEFASTKRKGLPARKGKEAGVFNMGPAHKPAPKGHHRMPSGKIMKGSTHKGKKGK